MSNYPHQQAFNKEKASSASAERRNNGVSGGRNLKGRIKDYEAMIAKPKIADGHRGPEGYTKPGSNKK